MSGLKFRAWHPIEKVMSRIFSFLDLHAGGQLFGEPLTFSIGVDYNDTAAVVMQFTGLKDKNGKEIYEGDIVSHKRNISSPSDYHSGEPLSPDGEYSRIGHVTITTSKGVVLNGRQSFNPDDFDVTPATRKYNENPGCWSEFGEVVGNIHENPELLEK